MIGGSETGSPGGPAGARCVPSRICRVGEGASAGSVAARFARGRTSAGEATVGTAGVVGCSGCVARGARLEVGSTALHFARDRTALHFASKATRRGIDVGEAKGFWLKRRGYLSDS